MQHSTCRRPVSILAASIAMCVGIVVPSAAQISRVGASTSVIPALTRGNDTAYDPVNRVYLVVGAHGTVNGAYVNESGVAVSGAFAISNPAAFAQFPHVIYSPEVNGTGGFLVVWHSADFTNGMNQIHARTVSFGGGLGAETVIGPVGAQINVTGSWWEAAPAGAFSTTSHVFLIAWQTYASNTIVGVIVSAGGQPLGSAFQISNPGDGGRDPGVAWNPNTNEFGVSMSGWDASAASASLVRVRASDGAIMRRTLIEHNAGSFITDVTFNSSANAFVMAWAGPGTKTAMLNGSGDVVARGLNASTVGTYDGLALAYNPVSGSILMVGHYSYEIGGVELDGTGAKIGLEQEVTSTGVPGSFYPRVKADSLTKSWDVSYSLNFGATAEQVVATGGAAPPPPPTDTDGDGVPDTVDQCPAVFAQTANGCPAAPPPPPPPPPPPSGCTSPKPGPNWVCVDGGWRPGTDTDGDGVMDGADVCPTIYAVTANGCPVQAPMNGNFDGTGGSQLVFVNKTTGSAFLWTLNNGVMTGGGYLWNANDPGWKIVGTSDLTGDGLSDVLWQNQQGDVRLFKMAYYSKVGQQTAGLQVADKNWRIVATGDFDNDGQADIVWQHLITGNVVVWFMKAVNGEAVLQNAAYVTVNGVPVALGTAPWRVVGTSDFDGDGYRDLAFENAATGEMNIWGLGARNSGGIPIIQQQAIGTVNPDWQIKAIANYGGDAKADALFQSTSTGLLFLWVRSGNAFVPYGYLNSPAVVWEASGPR